VTREDAWPALVDHYRAFVDHERSWLVGNLSDALVSLERALGVTGEREVALTVLQRLPYAVRSGFVETLVLLLANSVRETQQVRDLLLSLPADVVRDRVIPLVDRALVDADAEAYRRYAELLRDMGSPYLGVLIRRARESSDLEIRAVADDFAEMPGAEVQGGR
jgi:hypothetical protein